MKKCRNSMHGAIGEELSVLHYCWMIDSSAASFLLFFSFSLYLLPLDGSLQPGYKPMRPVIEIWNLRDNMKGNEKLVTLTELNCQTQKLHFHLLNNQIISPCNCNNNNKNQVLCYMVSPLLIVNLIEILGFTNRI